MIGLKSLKDNWLLIAGISFLVVAWWQIDSYLDERDAETTKSALSGVTTGTGNAVKQEKKDANTFERNYKSGSILDGVFSKQNREPKETSGGAGQIGDYRLSGTESDSVAKESHIGRVEENSGGWPETGVLSPDEYEDDKADTLPIGLNPLIPGCSEKAKLIYKMTFPEVRDWVCETDEDGNEVQWHETY